jgi:hypothetical protein
VSGRVQQRAEQALARVECGITLMDDVRDEMCLSQHDDATLSALGRR